jgi:DNA invertase Pin-like site-specific DNA recombinase
MPVGGALTDFERDLIPERTMAGLAVARDPGSHRRRPTKMTRSENSMTVTSG